MKKQSLLVFALLPVLLASCSKTNELYKDHAYDTGTLMGNYYLEHNNVDKLTIQSSSEKVVAPENIYISNPGFGKALDGVAKEDQTYTDKDGKETFLEWNIDTPIDDFGKGFGPTMNLSSIDKAFMPGFLSRLYDGRIRCDGYYANSRVQLNKTGFSTFFPKEMITGKYLAISVRGQSDAGGGFEFANSNVSFDLTLYRHIANSQAFEAQKIKINNVLVPMNTHGNTSLLVVYFADIFGPQWNKYIEGTIAMTLTFTLNDIIGCEADKAKYGMPVDDKNDKNNPHYSMMIYEIMFPKSTWR